MLEPPSPLRGNRASKPNGYASVQSVGQSAGSLQAEWHFVLQVRCFRAFA